MSAELIIIPLAMAASFAFKAARERMSDQVHPDLVYAWRVATIMRDKTLVATALEELGLVPEWDGETARLTVGGWRVGLVPIDDRYYVLIEEGTTQEEAIAFASQIDETYTRCVQEAVVKRVQEQAGQAGLALTGQQRNADDSITLTLQVGSHG